MASPYQTPKQVSTYPTGQDQVMAPLVGAAGWLQLIGWFYIIYGALVCLTIVGLVIGWLPLWMGILAKNAGDAYKSGGRGDSLAFYHGNRNLSTAITILGVLLCIGIALMGLYILFFVGMLVFAIMGAAAAS